ncbi:MAG: hypothetical protein QM296_02685 [Bacillota bacterium]|nr:hypothetical protein [Bacillota bacterium]
MIASAEDDWHDLALSRKLRSNSDNSQHAVQRRARLLCGQDKEKYKILFVKLSILTLRAAQPFRG